MRASLLLGVLGIGLALGCSQRPATSPSDVALAPGAKRLPARVRRLTNLELERTLSALVGAEEPVAELLPPDVRQEGYSENSQQGVPAAFATRLDQLAREIAKRAVKDRLGELAPCSATPARSERRCAEALVSGLARRAYRRPPSAEEKSDLIAAFDAGAADGGGFAGGAEVVLRTLMQSPALLYLTELGSDGASGAHVTLTPHEIAAALSYTLRGAPPDEQLLALADSNSLLDPDAREREARRLIGMSDTRQHFRRFVLEWLEVDGLERTAKSEALAPEYDALKSRMLAETSAFVDEVMVSGGASVRSLLTAGFASVDPPMARFYGLETWGERATLAGTGRAGILQQASFLSAHAHEDATSPVKRGDFVMRRLLCSEVPRPADLGIDLVIPPPSSALTTRERFHAHVADPACQSCHATLDALGFTFEGFDAAGRRRTHENGKRVDTASVALVGGARQQFASSLELSHSLAKAPEVSDCFARQAFRYFSAQHDSGVEQSFLELRRALPPELRGNLIEELVRFVRSDLFVERAVAP
jgi:hypothetical protein